MSEGYQRTGIHKEINRFPVTIEGMALDGYKNKRVAFVAHQKCGIVSIKMRYNVDAAVVAPETEGVNIWIGTETEPVKFSSAVSEATASLGDVIDLELVSGFNVLSENDTIIIRSSRAKQGAGAVSFTIIIAELE